MWTMTRDCWLAWQESWRESPIRLCLPTARSGPSRFSRDPVHVIVTDMRMPELSGLELLQTVKQQYPHVIRLVLSGDDEVATLLGAINEGEILRFIRKPWKSSEELRTTIRQAIEFYDLHSEREMLMNFFEVWVEGLEPDSVDVQFLRALVATRKKHLYQWRQRCESVGSRPE